MSTASRHDRALSAPENDPSLDTVQLARLEHAFRTWAESPKSASRRLSRVRILLIFLMIRYTGGRLNEILTLNPKTDVDFDRHTIRLYKSENRTDADFGRDVQVMEKLTQEMRVLLSQFDGDGLDGQVFKVDPGHVRRKFYERAEAAGFPKEAGTPDAIRKARAIELLKSGVPLPVVQKILGHSTPNLAAGYVDFSEEEMRQAERFYIERESRRKTSARNAFYGKIDKVVTGDVQAMVEIVTLDGFRIAAVITGYSLSKLGLRPGSLVAAEVKAPWVMLFKGETEPAATCENCFRGSVIAVVRGKVSTEVDVRISENTDLCAVITDGSRQKLDLKKHESVWAAFNAAAVVIHAD